MTLTATSGYTLTGVAADYFTVSGATATNSADSGVVSAVFPTTANAVINTAAIAGVTAPVAGATPVTTTTAGTGYTGTVTWSPSVSGTFAYNTAYTATVTLTAASGYTLDGVTANYFTVSGATATNSADSGVVTAVFPSTLPSGYVSHNGLIWAYLTDANWPPANSICSTSTALDYTQGTWRLPTINELENLGEYLLIYRGIGRSMPEGWTSDRAWSSSSYTYYDFEAGDTVQDFRSAVGVYCVHPF